MKGYLSFFIVVLSSAIVVVVVYSLIKIMNVKKLEKVLSSDDDDFQFGPWICAMAPKFSQKKSNFSQSNPREEDDDEIHVSKDEKGEAKSSQIYHQLTIPLLARKSNEMAVRHQLDGPTRNYIEQEN